MSSKIALDTTDESNAEAEADALLEQDDLERSGRGEDFKDGLEQLEREEGLPPPNIQAVPAIRKIHPAPIIGIWILLSSSVIVFNAYILSKDNLNFPFPIFLTTVHLAYATLGTRLMIRFTHLLDGVHNIDMTWDRYLRNIVPIGALFSGSLVCSNVAYIYLSISFIQMLKAFTSVAVLLMSILMGLEQFNRRIATIILAISFGVALASYGELKFSLAGFVFQSAGIMFEATRLVAIQKLLQGMRMDPLVSLYYFAPVCFLLNALLIPIFEGWTPFELIMPRVGPFLLFLNVNVALCLNISVVYLIGCASSLILTLSGVVKDIMLVTGSFIFFGEPITGIQIFGYSIALSGLMVFKTPPEVMASYIARAKAMVGL